MIIKRFTTGLLTAAALAFATAAHAEFPDKPINMIIGFAAGGGTDLAGRALATELQDVLGQPVVVVNQPGAASMISAGNVAKARPDGYTVWFGSAGTLITKEALGQAPTTFGDGLKLSGFSGTLVAALGVPLNSPFNSIEEIIATAKERPGELRWSHNGVGAAFMVMGQGFVTANGLDVVGVPFQGAAAIRGALSGAQTDFGVLNAGDRLRLGDDQFKILAAIASDRSQVLDDNLPTLTELEIDFVEVPSPIGVMVPAGVDDKINKTLAAAIEQATSRDSFKEAMTKIFIPVTFMNSEDGTAYVSQLQQNVRELLPKLRK